MSEPCRACGAVLAEDQRYCLNCGERRGGPRLDFRQHLDSRGEVPAAGATSSVETAAKDEPAKDGGRRQRDYAPLAAAAGIAVLGVMLLIGVLIGRGTGTSTGSSAQPQVITVGAADTGAEAEGGNQAAPKQQQRGDGNGKAKAGKNAKASSGGRSDTGNAPVVSEEQLQDLQEQSPEEYSESSAKLPDEVATPGKAPPPDGKAPGGGSGGTTIE